MFFFFFFFNDTATTEIYTLSLHDALPICQPQADRLGPARDQLCDRLRARRPRSRAADPSRSGLRGAGRGRAAGAPGEDRKSTRLNSSHLVISYAVFCLKKKKKQKIIVTC